MLMLFLTVAMVHIVALMSPGPDFFFVSQTAVSRSRKEAMMGVLGITCGGKNSYTDLTYVKICISKSNFQHIYTKILSFYTIISYNIIIRDNLPDLNSKKERKVKIDLGLKRITDDWRNCRDSRSFTMSTVQPLKRLIQRLKF